MLTSLSPHVWRQSPAFRAWSVALNVGAGVESLLHSVEAPSRPVFRLARSLAALPRVPLDSVQRLIALCPAAKLLGDAAWLDSSAADVSALDAWQAKLKDARDELDAARRVACTLRLAALLPQALGGRGDRGKRRKCATSCSGERDVPG